MSRSSLVFKGNFGEEPDEPKTWEKFKVVLFAKETGELIDEGKQIRKILKASGYKLILKKKSSRLI